MIKHTVCKGMYVSVMLLTAFSIAISFPPSSLAGEVGKSTHITNAPCNSIKIAKGLHTFRKCGFPPGRKRAKLAANVTARSFLNQYSQSLGMGVATDSDLQKIQVKNGLGGTEHTLFQQHIDGYPIYGAYVSVHQLPNSLVHKVHSKYRKNHKILGPTKASFTLGQAETAALGKVGQEQGGVAKTRLPTQSKLVWYPVEPGVFQLAWELMLFTEKPLGVFHTIVNATSGDILHQENQLVFFETGRGYVYQPNPIQTSGDTSLQDNNDVAPSDPGHPLNSELIEVELLGLEHGTGLLKGEFVDLSTHTSSYYPQSTYPDADNIGRDYFYDRSDVRFEQVVAYHAIDSLQRYIHSLGYDDDTGSPNGIRDFPTQANVHWYDNDQSFYDQGADTLQYGDGGVDDAEDADIVIHEYGHAIQHNQNICWPAGVDDGDMRAMGEGFSDYLAASFFAESGAPGHQSSHAACIGEWDSTAYGAGIPTCLRRVDTNKVYPKDLDNDDYHLSGEIWSRALWDIRQGLGGPTADKLILEHHFSVPCNATMPIAALEIIDSDATLNNGVNEILLRQTFCDRGILNDRDCESQSGKVLTIAVEKDSFLHERVKNSNEGAHPLLRVKEMNKAGSNTNRAVVGFELTEIDLSRVRSAKLVLHIAYNDSRWSETGGVDAYPLQHDFTEGSGRQAGVTGTDFTLGSGSGVTWNCREDIDISNNDSDCSTTWSGAVSSGNTLAVPHTNTMQGKVEWDVTTDVKTGARGWLLKKNDESSSGRVYYYSKEGAAIEGNVELAPYLYIVTE